MNKVMLLGRLTKDAEIKFSQTSKTKVASFTLAVNRKYAKTGEERQTDFISISAFSKLADFAEKYLKRGIQICIAGRIQIRNWTDSEGNRRYITDIIADEIYFADSFKKFEDGESTDFSVAESNETDTTIQETQEQSTLDDDDLPF